MKKNNRLNSIFEKCSNIATKKTGTPGAFIIAFGIIIMWVITGPMFHFSDTWQLVINTGTTIITFLMVFLIQQAQNKDTMALQLKLNELIAASKHTSNRLISIEDLTDAELTELKKFYAHLAMLSKKETDLFTSHSLDEAQNIHSNKLTHFKKETEDK